MSPIQTIFLRSPWTEEKAARALRLLGRSDPASVKALIELACKGYTVENAVKVLRSS